MQRFFSFHLSPLFFLLLTWGIFFLWALQNLFFYNQSGEIQTKFWTVSGDWAMHLSQVQAFYDKNFLEVLTNNPLYSEEILSYPFAINWISGKIFALTENLEFSLLSPLFFFFPLLLLGLYFLGYQLTKNKWASVLGIFFIFLGGGTAIEMISENFSGLSEFAQNQELEHNGYFWKSFFLTLLFPQRALFFGLTVGSILLAIFFAWKNAGIQKISTQKLFLLGLAMGIMSIIHTHTFLFLGLFGIFYSIFDWKNFPKFFWIGLGAMISSLPFLYLLSLSSAEFSPIVQWQWMGNRYKENFFIFWIQNWGIFFLIPFFYILLTLIRHPSSHSVIPAEAGISPEENHQNKTIYSLKNWSFYKHRILGTIPCGCSKDPPYIFISIILLIFLLANIFQFQNNPWDNGKIFLWIFIFLAFWTAKILCEWWRKNFLWKFFSLLGIFLGIISGIFLLFQPLFKPATTLFSVYDQELAQKFSEKISPEKLVLTPDYHLFFVSTLTKNSIVMGYRGWIGSYGIDYSQRLQDIKKIYEGKKSAKILLKKYHIGVVVLSPFLYKEMRVNTKFFEENFQEIFSFGSVRVFDIRES